VDVFHAAIGYNETGMQYRRLGSSGLKVSALSLGSWLTIGNTVGATEAAALVRAAFEAGINLLDTADVYARGDGERALGAAIAGLRRESLVLASKCFFPMSDEINDRGLSRKHVFESLHASLRRLGTDYLDLYQCHRPDPQTPIAETAMAMDDLIRQGKVLYWGVSLWEPAQIAEAVQICRSNGLHAPIANQPPYSLLERGIEVKVMPACAELGISQIVFSPLAQGVLTGKYGSGGAPGADTRAGDDRINQFIGRHLTPDNHARVAALARLAARRGVRPAQVALAWCLRRAEVSSAIIGARTVAQLEENLGALDVELGAAELRELDAQFPAA
jgi:voltage-dependent potassium channel beta subunit